MSSLETYQERLRGELAAIEDEIKDHNQQIEALTKRIESLKRALELFASDQAAIAELLGWNCKESNLTGQQLYTHPERFTHTAGDRSGKNPSRWSVK